MSIHIKLPNIHVKLSNIHIKLAALTITLLWLFMHCTMHKNGVLNISLSLAKK